MSRKTIFPVVGLFGCLLAVGCQAGIPWEAKPVMTGKKLLYVAPEDGRTWIKYNASLWEKRGSRVLTASSIRKGGEVRADMENAAGDATIWYAVGPALPPEKVKEAFESSRLVPKDARLVAKGDGVVLATSIKEEGTLHVVDRESREVVLVVHLPSAVSNDIRIAGEYRDKVLTVEVESKIKVMEKFRSSGHLDLYFVKTP